jgi:hypothetical protein
MQAVPVSKWELDDDQERIAQRVSSILEEKDADGEYKYSKDEVRDFMMACCFELGLPMSFELESVMHAWIARLGVDPRYPTPEMIIDAVRAHFDANPLHPDLNKAFKELAQDEVFKQREGFKHDGRAVNAALASAGLQARVRAPRATELPRAKRAAPRLKRGLA